MADELSQLFPLTTTSFERYMIADDRASHPMAPFMELEIRGEIDLSCLASAFALAIDRHPLLRARIRYNAWGLPCWVSAPPRLPDIAEWAVPLTCPGGERLDLTSGTGMRVWVRHAAERARITIQVHHACSDALGKLTFLADWLTLYARLAGHDRAVSLPAPNWDALRRRDHPAAAPAEVRRIVRPAGLLHDLKQFFYRPTVRLPGEPYDATRERLPLPGLYGVSVGEHVVQRIRHDASRYGVTLNDWLMAALYVAMARWTETHGPQPARKAFRVTFPYSTRMNETLYSPASNQIAYEILSYPATAAVDFAELVQNIARCTAPVRALRTSSFRKLLRASTVYSQLFPLITRYWGKSFATIIFSNLGDVSRLFDPLVEARGGRWIFGNLVVERIRCAPPTRPQSHLAMVTMRYGGRLHFMTRCEGRVLASKSIRGFLDLYQQTVLELAGIEKEDAVSAAQQPQPVTADSA